MPTLRKLVSFLALISTVLVALLDTAGASAAPFVAPVTGSPFSTGVNSHPRSVAFSPAGGLLATANGQLNSVSLFTVSGTALTPVAGSPFSAGLNSAPYSVAFSTDGTLLATADDGTDQVSLFSVSSSGLTTVPGSPFTTGGSHPVAVAFSTNGTLLATANSAGNSVSMFKVSGSGLTPVAGSPFSTGAGTHPASVAFSSSGDLATANPGTNSVSLFAAQPSGLTPKTGSPFSTGVGSYPVSVAFAAGGDVLSVADNNTGRVSSFSVSASGLTAVAGSPLATGSGPSSGPQSVAIAPNQGPSLLASANYEDNTVSLFVVSPQGMQSVPGATFSIGPGSQPNSIAFSPNPSLLAVADYGTDSVSLFSLAAPSISIATPVSGATFVQGQAVAAGYACHDATGGPGIASCAGDVPNGSPIATSTLGQHSFLVQTNSVSGLSAQQTNSYTVVKASPGGGGGSPSTVGPPSAVISTPASGMTFTQGQRVLAGFGCQEASGGPGISSCVGTVPNGSAINTGAVGLHTFTLTALSSSGQTGSASSTYTVVAPAVGPPAASLAVPAPGAVFFKGEVVKAAYACHDAAGAPGISSCTGTTRSGDPIQTSRIGAYRFTLTASSHSGRTTTITRQYTVLSPPPVLSAVTESRSTWRLAADPARRAARHRARVGTTFTFTLNEPARVTLAFSEERSGRRTAHGCSAITRTNRRQAACRRTSVAGSLGFAALAGMNRAHFMGRFTSPSRALTPGGYTLTITATDAAGRQSTPRHLNFTIIS